MTPHCTTPERCSVCLGATPKIVTVASGVVHVDGQPEVAKKSRAQRYAKRGAEATRRKHAPKPERRVR